ncbi:hypothetical protein HWA87_gp01 [Salmonella phage 35]|uniref:Uncharacterized protein n=1 Tax=Salmonella phage 35 TaxID=1654888 RepID=A0A0N7CE47_9CAUD|nr:hypothetical protein HWA87_gp01 [Salmonella phage 35]AKJ74064.1 hypothetical protein SP35_1 [Salmonella phage 35]
MEGVLAALKGGAVNTSADAGSETTEKQPPKAVLKAALNPKLKPKRSSRNTPKTK